MDAHETARQDVQQESAQELVRTECHCLLFVADQLGRRYFIDMRLRTAGSQYQDASPCVSAVMMCSGAT